MGHDFRLRSYANKHVSQLKIRLVLKTRLILRAVVSSEALLGVRLGLGYGKPARKGSFILRWVLRLCRTIWGLAGRKWILSV